MSNAVYFDQIKQLVELQKVDDAIHSVKQDLSRAPSELDALERQAAKDAERRARDELAAQKRRDREAAAEARRQEREAERLRKQTVNAGVKIARVIVGKLFGELSERYKERTGGYTRIVKSGYRIGDNAPMSVIEFVQNAEAEKPKKKVPASKK